MTHRNAALWFVAAAGSLVANPHAQCDFFSQTIRAQNAQFTQIDVPDTRTSIGGSAAFTADSGNQQDVLFAMWHYYRLDAQNREVPFKDNPGQCVRVTYANDAATLFWADVDNRGQISAQLVQRVSSSGFDSGCVTNTMTVTNISQSPVTFDLFTYVDVDLCGSANNTAVAVNNDGTRQLVRNQTGCSNDTNVEFQGINADRFEAAPYASLRSKLLDASRDDLTNSGLPFGPADYTAAVQWQGRVIPPGESRTYTSTLCHNIGRCPTRASSVNYGTGLAGGNGLATISTTQLPIISRTAELAIGNALPRTSGLLIAGFGRTNTQIGNVTLLTGTVNAYLLPVDGTGAGRMPFPIPADPNLCAGTINFQFLFVDPAVQGMFPVAHTDGLEWTLGS